MLINLPNLLTLSRVILIPVIVFVYYLVNPTDYGHFLAAIIFALASATDWLDGYLARKLNQMTPLGAFLDPVADKVIVAVALAMLVETYAEPLLTVPAMVIISREIVISALREWMAEMGKRASVAVSFLGKVKTTCQMISITGLLAFSLGTPLAYASLTLLYVAAVLTLWSMIIYIKAAWPELRG